MINSTQYNKIYQEQRKALRYIENKPFITNYNKIHKEKKILKLHDIIKLETLKFSFKLNKGYLPQNVTQFFDYGEAIHGYYTRNRNSARITEHKTNFYNKSILNKAVSEWLKVPVTTRNILKLKTFAKTLKNNIISEY
jgi:hypothetical protein